MNSGCCTFLSLLPLLRRVVVLAHLLLMMCLASRAAVASGLLTNADPAELRVAIEQGGVIQLAFSGVVKIASPFVITTDTVLDGSGQTIVFDAGQACRHFAVETNATLRLVNLSLVNGRFAGPADSEEIASGGAIMNAGGNLELVDCRLTNNVAIGSPGTAGGHSRGGAVCSLYGRAVLNNCVFDHNQCLGGETQSDLGGDAVGGAVYVKGGSLTISGGSFTGNQAHGSGPANSHGAASWGGALYLGDCIASLSDCSFSENEARGADGGENPYNTMGGAVFAEGEGTLKIDRTLFSRNRALGGGPGPWVDGGVLFGSARGGAIYSGMEELELRNSALIGNEAKGGSIPADCCGFWGATAGSAWGGAIEAVGLTLVNCTLANNSASGGLFVNGSINFNGSAKGGAVRGDPVRLSNVTFAWNSVFAGSGGSADVASVYGPVLMTNTLLVCASDQQNGRGPLDSDGGHNICSDASLGFTSKTSRGNVDPMLGTLGYYGGPTPTVPLLSGSPALDAGDDSAAPASDQRGVRRPQGFASDIGAFEAAPILRVSCGDSGGVKLSYSFPLYKTNLVYASTNLVDWISLATAVSDASGAFDFEDPADASLPHRFYKVLPNTTP